MDKVKIDDSIYILTYNEINDYESIKNRVSSYNPFSNLKCYASLKVVRYEWENGLLVDLCKFDKGYYVIGTHEPKQTIQLRY